MISAYIYIPIYRQDYDNDDDEMTIIMMIIMMMIMMMMTVTRGLRHLRLHL